MNVIGRRVLVLLGACLAMGSCAVLAAGCAGPTYDLVSGSSVRNSAANTASMTDDEWIASYHGFTATQTIVDGQGINTQGGSIYRVMGVTYDPETGQFRIALSDPSDTIIDSLSVTFPDGPSMDMTGFSAGNSNVISAHDVVSAYEAQGLITTEQADVYREAIQAGSETASSIISKIITGGAG